MGSVRVGSAVLIVDEGRVLLGRRGKQPNFGRWVLPGGKVELYETLEDAARREASEETGLAVEVIARLGVHEVIDEQGEEHRLIVFSQAQVLGGTLSASSDLLEARFFDRYELQTLDVTPVVRDVLEQAGWLEPSRLIAAS